MHSWVEDALTETVSWVRDGSYLFVGEDARERLKDRYRGDFVQQYDDDLDWDDVRDRIRPLAIMVGSFATILAIHRSYPAIPDYVGISDLLSAACLVSIIGPCSLQPGGFCGDVCTSVTLDALLKHDLIRNLETRLTTARESLDSNTS